MLKSVLPLSFIIATRFFGLFILLPVLSLYALSLQGANEDLIGLLFGIYAITQMFLQTPFGVLSDKIGRKNTLAIGLCVFIIGSSVCAFSEEIHAMIFGRFLQGCGAVGAVATALISDFTTEEDRGKAMAIMGAMIGVSFGAAMILSPYLSAKYGLASLFHLSSALTLLCLLLLFLVIPKEPQIRSFKQKAPLLILLRDKNLMLMNLTNFFQKAFMTTAFLLIPILLVQKLGLSKNDLIKVYALAAVFGFASMGASGALGEKKALAKQILLLGICFFVLSYLIFAFARSAGVFIVGVMLFFVGFNAHEPIMQSLASKFAKAGQKGATLGIFNSFGFFGSFVGGLCGGILFGKIGVFALSIAVAALGCVWFILLLGLTDPKIFKNLYFQKGADGDFAALKDQNGVIEIYETDKNLVVKFNSNLTDEERINEALRSRNGI